MIVTKASTIPRACHEIRWPRHLEVDKVDALGGSAARRIVLLNQRCCAGFALRNRRHGLRTELITACAQS